MRPGETTAPNIDANSAPVNAVTRGVSRGDTRCLRAAPGAPWADTWVGLCDAYGNRSPVFSLHLTPCRSRRSAAGHESCEVANVLQTVLAQSARRAPLEDESALEGAEFVAEDRKNRRRG